MVFSPGSKLVGQRRDAEVSLIKKSRNEINFCQFIIRLIHINRSWIKDGTRTEMFVLRGDQSIYARGFGLWQVPRGNLGRISPFTSFLRNFSRERFLLHWFLFPRNGQIKLTSLVVESQIHVTSYERADASMFAKLALGFTFLKEKFQFKSWSFYKVKKKNHFVSGFLWPLRIRYSSRMLNQHCWYHFDIFGFSSSWMLKRSFGI